MTEEELKQKLSDPWWRLTSGCLYKIMIKGDKGEESLVVPFIPNESQLKLLNNLHWRNLILKARQLGFTTLISIYFLDCVLFKANVRAGMIAQDLPAAQAIFRDKVKFAYDNLPDALREAMPLERDSQSELLFGHNNSSIRVATSMRSGTIHYLHVSEFGKICAYHPERAKEVVTGSLPAVPVNGMAFIESTAEGPDGEFYKMSRRAETLMEQGAELNSKDFKFHFFPWWSDSSYRAPVGSAIITAADNEYFDQVESKTGCVIDAEQREWWCMTRDADFSGDPEKMWQEYPSTSAEAFQNSTEGCFYSVQLAAARKQGRITHVPYREGYVVNTFWDIGHGDGTAIWFHQRIGQHDNFIAFLEGWGEPYSYYVEKMQRSGWIWGTHYLPHDGNHRRQGMNNNLSPKEMLEELGLRNIEIVPVTPHISHGIQATRRAFSSAWFDETLCKEGIVHLDNYRKKYSTTNQRFTDEPRHDIHSEAADAFRQFGQSDLDQAGDDEDYYEPDRTQEGWA